MRELQEVRLSALAQLAGGCGCVRPFVDLRGFLWSGDYFRRQRAEAAFLAIARRSLPDRLSARAFPPLRPSSTAALFLPSSVSLDSFTSPVAIRMIWTALPITSGGRF